MAATVSEIPQASVASIVRNLAFAIRLSWVANPTALTVHVVAQMVQSLVPAASVAVTAMLVDAVRNSATAGMGPVLAMVLVQMGLLVAQYTLGTAAALSSQLGQQQTANHVMGRIAAEVQHRPFDVRQTTAFNEDVAFLRYNAPHRIYQPVNNLVGMVGAVVTAIGVFGVIGRSNTLLGGVVLLATLPTLYAAHRAAGLQFRASVGQAGDMYKANYFYQLLLERKYAAEIRLHSAGGFLRGAWRTHVDRALDRAWRAFKGQTAVEVPAQVVNIAALAGTTLAFGTFAARGALTVGGFVADTQGMVSIQGAATLLYRSVSALLQVGLYTERLRLFLQEESASVRATTSPAEVVGQMAASAPPATERATAVLSPKNLLELEDVGYRYAGSPYVALHDVTVSIPQGLLTALIGANGAGKTTLLHILAGLSRPSEGIVRTHPSLGTPSLSGFDSVALVAQEFSDYRLTLYENVALQPDAADEVTKARVERALLAAGCDDLLARVGLHGQLGPEMSEGTGLSRGEWQRVAVARVLYRSAQLLLLDEPTASADGPQRHAIRELLYGMRGNRTVVTATHDFDLVDRADHVVFLHQGGLLAIGAPKNLERNCDAFRRLRSLSTIQWERDREDRELEVLRP